MALVVGEIYFYKKQSTDLMKKGELRAYFLEKRKQLTDPEIKSQSTRICINLFESIDFSSMKVIHTFLPIVKNKEPDTWVIIKQLQQNYPDTKISVPRVRKDLSDLDHFYLNDSDLIQNTWGIVEPAEGIETGILDIDLVLVPLLAYDQFGNRVGYGKGYYDRFLAKCRKDTIKVGISFFNGVERIDDSNEFDQPLHYCITPDDVMKF